MRTSVSRVIVRNKLAYFFTARSVCVYVTERVSYDSRGSGQPDISSVPDRS